MIIKTYPLGPLQANTYIAANPETKEAVIFDPGGPIKKIKEVVEKNGFSVKAIMITHGHFDHRMGANEAKEFFKVKIYAGEKDDLDLAVTENDFTGEHLVFEPVVMDVPLKDGETFELIGFKWKAISTPGHSIGSTCYYVESEKVLFSGDTLFKEEFGRYDFLGGSLEELKNSIINKLFKLPDDVKVYPGHGWPTSISYEKSNNMIRNY